VGRDVFLVITLFVIAFLAFKQPHRDTSAIDTPHVRIEPQERAAAKVIGDTARHEGFTIQINDRIYRQNASIRPSLPLMATFNHSDPAVTKIRMQHPQRPDLHIIYPLGQQIRIINHETYMRRGQISSSEFLAQDAQDNIYDRILIEFKP
jgi:hypothetical protein